MHVASATQQLMVGQVRDINDITIKIDKKLAPNNSAAAGVIPPRKKKKETRQVSSDINKCPWWPKFQVKIRDSKPQKNIIGMEMNNDRNHLLLI